MIPGHEFGYNGFDRTNRKCTPTTFSLGAKQAELSVLSDTNYAQPDDYYHPIRGTLAEVEFIDVPAVDALLNTGTNAGAVKTAIVNGMRDQIIEDLIQQPAQ